MELRALVLRPVLERTGRVGKFLPSIAIRQAENGEWGVLDVDGCLVLRGLEHDSLHHSERTELILKARDARLAYGTSSTAPTPTVAVCCMTPLPPAPTARATCPTLLRCIWPSPEGTCSSRFGS